MHVSTHTALHCRTKRNAAITSNFCRLEWIRLLLYLKQAQRGQPALVPLKQRGQPALVPLRQRGQPALMHLRQRGQPALVHFRQCGQPALVHLRQRGQPTLVHLRQRGQPALVPLWNYKHLGARDFHPAQEHISFLHWVLSANLHVPLASALSMLPSYGMNLKCAPPLPQAPVWTACSPVGVMFVVVVLFCERGPGNFRCGVWEGES